MKPRIVFHYFLYLAIILGAFASMAQNDYGLTVVSWSCYLFALSIILELIERFGKLSWDKRIELSGLAILLFLFGLRAAYIHFAFVETLLLIISTLLIAVYVLHAFNKTKRLGSTNSRLRNLILVYYLSLISFTLSMSIAILLPSLTEIVGGTATALLALFFLGMLLSRRQLIDGVEVKTTDFLRKQAGHSIVLMTGFLLISLYSGLHMIGVIPSLYTDKIPQAYIQLINDAETGKESAVDGVYQHEIYKDAYDRFLEKQEKGE
jgi:hypothetical protein